MGGNGRKEDLTHVIAAGSETMSSSVCIVDIT